tara:strand:- start:4 stop:375 length:372 start_codon:yes stop_codon:yes gene_type:complete
MTHKLKFNSNKSLVKLARNTIAASKFKIAYRNKSTTDKCFYLVKDDGIYLMNCYETDRDKPNSVVYASGFNPKFNEDVWEDTHAISGDDFAENIYLTKDQLERIANGGSVNISLSETQIEVRA